MGRIEAVSFDLDDTLVRYERSPGEVLAISFERLGIDPAFEVEAYYDRYDEFVGSYDTLAAAREACFATLAAENGHERGLGREIAAVFEDERDQSNVEPLPGVPGVLGTLGEEYRLGVLTNGSDEAQREKVAAAGLDAWLDTVVVAGRDPPPKPDPAAFERVVRSLDASPATTIHVGDSLETDVAGAAAAGLDSVWISAGRDSGEFDPTYRLPSIAELSASTWEE